MQKSGLDFYLLNLADVVLKISNDYFDEITVEIKNVMRFVRKMAKFAFKATQFELDRCIINCNYSAGIRIYCGCREKT